MKDKGHISMSFLFTIILILQFLFFSLKMKELKGKAFQERFKLENNGHILLSELMWLSIFVLTLNLITFKLRGLS